MIDIGEAAERLAEQERVEQEQAREKAYALMKQKVEEAKLVASSITGVPVADMTPSFLMVNDCDDEAVFTIVYKEDGDALIAKVCGGDDYVTLYLFGKLKKDDQSLTAIWTPEWDLGDYQYAIDSYAE